MAVETLTFTATGGASRAPVRGAAVGTEARTSSTASAEPRPTLNTIRSDATSSGSARAGTWRSRLPTIVSVPPWVRLAGVQVLSASPVSDAA